MAGTIVANLSVTAIQLYYTTLTDKKDFTTAYEALVLIQIIAAYIFVISKRPKDLFRHFNKRPDVQFSVF